MSTEVGAPDLNAPATQATARPMLEQLRVARLAGAVTTTDYAARADYLARLDAGEQVDAPNLNPSQEQLLERGLEEAYKPGEPHDFKLPQDPMRIPTEAQVEIDTKVRQALTDLGVPVRLGGPIVERIEHVAKTLGPLSPAERQAKVSAFQAELRSRWGADYKKRTKAIWDHVVEGTNKHEAVAELIDQNLWLFADVALNEWLWSLVEHKQR